MDGSARADRMLVVRDAPSPNFDQRRGPPDMLVLHYTGMRTADEAVARLRACIFEGGTAMPVARRRGRPPKNTAPN